MEPTPIKRSFDKNPLKILPILKIKSEKVIKPEDSCPFIKVDFDAFVGPKKVKYIKRNE
jgi:hypothetical protein